MHAVPAPCSQSQAWGRLYLQGVLFLSACVRNAPVLCTTSLAGCVCGGTCTHPCCALVKPVVSVRRSIFFGTAHVLTACMTVTDPEQELTAVHTAPQYDSPL
jgi:hypothetical protein